MPRKNVVVDHTQIWKLATILALLVSVIALGIYGFENRTPIVEAITGRKLFSRTMNEGVPGSESQKQLQRYVETHGTVVGISVGKADFVANTRQHTYFFFNTEELNDAWDAGKNMKPELFSDDASLNDKLVLLINGRFVCSPVGQTVPGKLFPLLRKYSTTVCSIAVPPGYGDFVGWIHVYLDKPPTYTQATVLETNMRKMSKQIYDRDIIQVSGDNRGSKNTIPSSLQPSS